MYEWKDKTTQKLYSHHQAAKGSTLNTVGEIWGKLANYQLFIGFRFTPFHCLRHPLNCKKINTRTGKWTLFSSTANSTTRMYSSRAFIWVGHTFRFPLKENELSTFWICKKMNPDQHIIGLVSSAIQNGHPRLHTCLTMRVEYYRDGFCHFWSSIFSSPTCSILDNCLSGGWRSRQLRRRRSAAGRHVFPGNAKVAWLRWRHGRLFFAAVESTWSSLHMKFP